MALRILLTVLATLVSSCLAAEERKTIKLLFVPSDVMASLHKNLTVKDLPAGLPIGLPGQATQRWTPVRLPGDETHSFEIRLNPHTAHKLNLGFRQFRIGRGHGLLLELKNVSLSTKGRTVLDRLVEFYKNCGSRRRPHYGMVHRIQHHLPFPQHSLLLPGDVPLLKRIQSALERFFPRRHDGSVDVFQHKDSNGAVHFLPFDEVRREVNNLIKRTIASKDCIKISTNALTRALETFRSSNENSTTVNDSESTDLKKGGKVDSNNDNNNNNNNNNNQDDENSNILSFGRNLASLNSDRRNKVNFTSSVNVSSDAVATKIAAVLSDLRNEISSWTRLKGNQAIPNSDKDLSTVGSKDVKNVPVTNTIKIISNDSSENKGDEGHRQAMGFDLSEVKKGRKMMSSDKSDDKDSKDNQTNGSNDKDNNGQHTNALKITNTDMVTNTDMQVGKAESDTYLMEVKKNVSKITQDSTSSVHDVGGHDHSNIKIANASLDNLLELVKALKDAEGLKENKDILDLIGKSEKTKKVNKKVSSKVGRYRGRNKNKHRDKHRVKDKKSRKRPSVVFHYKYKPKSLRLKMHHKVKEDDNDDDDVVDEGSSEKYVGEGRFVKLGHMRRHRPRIKEMMLQDEEQEEAEAEDKHNKYMQRKFADLPVEESYTGAEDNARLLRKLRLLRQHGHASRKSPKLRVVVYDDDEDEKEPHKENWRNSESETFAEKIHRDDNEAVSGKSTDGSDPDFTDAENSQQYDQGETSNERPESNSDSDVQYLSDSIGTDDSSHHEQSNGAGGVPNLEPYLKKHFEDEEGEESEEIKLFNNQDDKFGETMEKRIGKASKQDDMVMNEKTNTIDNNEDDELGRIHLHKLPFNIQEDSDGVDTSLTKEQHQDDSLGFQRIFSPPAMPFMASRPSAMTSITPTAGQGIDLSPNIVMPPEQSTLVPPAAELPQVAGDSLMGRPDIAAFSGVNYQPSMTAQMNNMMPQTPFPQVGSMIPMQPGAPNFAPLLTPMMQPGQMRAFISGGRKRELKSGVRKTVTPKGPALKKKHSHKLN